MLDKATARELALRYADNVAKQVNPDAVIFFGSYVNGTPHQWSDIDIAVVIDDFSGNWLEISSMLYGLAWELPAGIEPHLLDSKNDRSGFVEHVKKTGEVLYSR